MTRLTPTTNRGLCIAGAGIGTLLVGALVIARCADAPPIVEFSVGKHGRFILVPVELASGQRANFLVDTGAAITIFDVSICPESSLPKGTTRLSTSAGDFEAVVLECPRASIGELALHKIGTAAKLDLSPFRLASGEDIRGVLGMDFLRSYAMEIDFDRGKFRLWNSAPSTWAQDRRIALSERRGTPHVELVLGNRTQESFAIDTGANSSTIRSGVFDDLAGCGELQSAAPRVAVTGGGLVRDKRGYLQTLRVDRFALQSTRFDRDPISALGLSHLARFRVRIDLASNSLYLSKSQRFDLPERTATSGLSILCTNSEKQVVAVEPTNRFSNIQPGDVIVAVNREDTRRLDVFTLAEMFTAMPERNIEVELRRGNKHFITAIVTRPLLPDLEN